MEVVSMVNNTFMKAIKEKNLKSCNKTIRRLKQLKRIDGYYACNHSFNT
jgi:hypothetical protein